MTDGLRYLVIEGPIAVGKASLAKRLADSPGGELLLERPENNPFLADFYRNPGQYALSTQLRLLMQRAQQAQQYRQDNRVDNNADLSAVPGKICDIRCGRHFLNRSLFPL